VKLQQLSQFIRRHQPLSDDEEKDEDEDEEEDESTRDKNAESLKRFH
jgi:hypothetical protein